MSVTAECPELYDAMRSYTAVALQLLSERCSEGPPEPLHFVDEWKRDSDGLFRLYDQSWPYWADCIRSNRDTLHNLDEYQRLLVILYGTPHIAKQIDQLIGTVHGQQRLEAKDIADRLIWSLAQSTGGLRFDAQAFDEQFRQLNTDLRRSAFSFIVLVPLLGVTAESLPIALPPDVEIGVASGLPQPLCAHR